MMGTAQKYEVLTLLPLAGTAEELSAMMGKVEERIRGAGGQVVSSKPLQKGRLSYPIKNTRQGYYHLIQFEIEPHALAELKRAILLARETLRFTITNAGAEFKNFVPSAPRPARTYSPAKIAAAPAGPPVRAEEQSGGKPEEKNIAAPAKIPVLSEKSSIAQVKEPEQELKKKVTMEELDKKLEEILGE